MFVRVVRFSEVTPERITSLKAKIEAETGPPPGVPSTGIQVLFDAEQGTAVVLQYFKTLEHLREGEAVLSAMPAGETPGVRVSVDVAELAIENFADRTA